jgi:indole-3-glycerol phosphate synthase
MENIMPGDLTEILLQKREEVKKIRFRLTIKESLKKEHFNVISEIKRRSPSKGNIGNILDPLKLAEKYVRGGAVAISILTDGPGFGGHLNDLKQVAIHLPDIPILRKDFILDERQLRESALSGASTILLIVSVLKDKTKELLERAKQMNLEAIIEIHNEKELEIALEAGAELIGVNNRDLSTFKVDLCTAEILAPLIPSHIVKIAESGIHTIEDARRMKQAGYDAILVGESLVKARDPVAFLKELISC